MGSINEITYLKFVAGDIGPFYKYIYRDMMLYAASLLPGSLSLMAEDCVQNAVEKTYYRREDFTSAQQWKAFIMTCIRNNAISLIRSQKANLNYVEYQEHTHQAHEDILLDYIKRETLSLLYNAIEELPSELKNLLLLSFEEGLKNAEIAERLGVAEITVKKRKAKLVALLRQQIGSSKEFIIILLLII